MKRKRIVPEDDELAAEACRPRKVWIGSGSLSSQKCMDWKWKGVITEEEGLKVEVCRSERVRSGSTDVSPRQGWAGSRRVSFQASVDLK